MGNNYRSRRSRSYSDNSESDNAAPSSSSHRPSGTTDRAGHRMSLTSVVRGIETAGKVVTGLGAAAAVYYTIRNSQQDLRLKSLDEQSKADDNYYKRANSQLDLSKRYREEWSQPSPNRVYQENPAEERTWGHPIQHEVPRLQHDQYQSGQMSIMRRPDQGELINFPAGQYDDQAVQVQRPLQQPSTRPLQAHNSARRPAEYQTTTESYDSRTRSDGGSRSERRRRNRSSKRTRHHNGHVSESGSESGSEYSYESSEKKKSSRTKSWVKRRPRHRC